MAKEMGIITGYEEAYIGGKLKITFNINRENKDLFHPEKKLKAGKRAIPESN